MNNNDNSRNGLMTKIWGPHGWVFLHSVTFGYPLNPTVEDKEKFKKFFELIGDILPCKFCRESYKDFIVDKENGTELNDEVMKDRESFTKWFYEIHNAVNKKLGMDYGIKYEDVVMRYESYRAQCIKSKKTCDVPEDFRAKSFKIANKKDCPLIQRELAAKIIPYARLRGIADEEFQVIKNCCGKTNDETWDLRNKECCEIINNMREDGVKSIESSGEWKGFPTKDETRLILRMSSNLSKKELGDVFKKLDSITVKPTTKKRHRYQIVKIQ